MTTVPTCHQCRRPLGARHQRRCLWAHVDGGFVTPVQTADPKARVERLVPPRALIIPDRRQCSVVLAKGPREEAWRLKHYGPGGRLQVEGWDPTRCHHGSVAMIDGKTYCSRHAGEIALKILTEEGTRVPDRQG